MPRGATKKTSYAKKPLKYWLLLYLIIGLVVYGLVYLFFFNNKEGYNYKYAPAQQYQNSPGT